VVKSFPHHGYKNIARRFGSIYIRASAFHRLNCRSGVFMPMRNMACLLALAVGFSALNLQAKPTTRPAALVATRPTTAPAVASSAATQPSAASIHALADKIKQMAEQERTTPKVAYFDLSRAVAEKPADFSLFGDSSAVTLRSLIERLRHARQDKDVRAVLITLGEPNVNLAEAQEIRDALVELRRAGKKTFVYADGYDTDTYTIASGATNVCLLPGGEIMIPGVGIETMYLKGLFDKLGVKADYVQIGEYKGADEEYTRTGPSPEFKHELNKLTDALYDQIVDGISLNRNLSKDAVKAVIDESILTADAAKDRGFVDHLVDEDGLRDLIAQEIGSKVELVKDYDAPEREQVDLSSPFALFALMMKKPVESTKPTVALVYADGVIVDGEGGGGLLGGATIGSDNIRRAMRIAGRDENVKAVVIRINSPGGSALASEAMWQSVRRVAKDKPVIISVGSMAASGGYYLASAGDHIFADSSAIVGSIGVVGGKFVTKDLYDKLGLTTQAFNRGRNADMFSSDTEFSDRQRRMVTNWMKQTYDQFTQRVMTTRGGKIKDIDQVARGRVFLAAQARDLGMVDEIGGIDRAIAYAANQADLKPDQYDVRIIPAPKTLADLINGNSEDAATRIRPNIELPELSMIKALSPNIRAMLGEQLQMVQLLQQRPILLASPVVIRVR
jgi:protease-4